MALGSHFEGPSGIQVALGGQFEAPSGVKVALGGRFEGPSGVQAALGEHLDGVQVRLGGHLQAARSPAWPPWSKTPLSSRDESEPQRKDLLNR